MKIVIQNGESITIVAPAETRSSVRIAVQTDHMPVVTVVVQDGLIGEVQEHVCRRHEALALPPATSPVVEDRLVLWGHLVSAHAGIFSLQATLEELLDMHEHEHNGPGTIRNHPRESRAYSIKKIGAVLSEAEDHDAAPADSASLEHEYLASYSGGREVGCHICRKPRSAHPIG